MFQGSGEDVPRFPKRVGFQYTGAKRYAARVVWSSEKTWDALQ